MSHYLTLDWGDFFALSTDLFPLLLFLKKKLQGRTYQAYDECAFLEVVETRFGISLSNFDLDSHITVEFKGHDGEIRACPLSAVNQIQSEEVEKGNYFSITFDRVFVDVPAIRSLFEGNYRSLSPAVREILYRGDRIASHGFFLLDHLYQPEMTQSQPLRLVGNLSDRWKSRRRERSVLSSREPRLRNELEVWDERS